MVVQLFDMVHHILLVCIAAWGHVRPALALAVRLVQERDDVVLTVLLPPNMLDKGFQDVELQFANKPDLAKRLRLISAFSASPNDQIFELMVKSAQAYQPVYQRLTAGEPLTCAMRGTVFEALPAPVAIIMDFLALNELQITRSITGYEVPVTGIIASGASPIIQVFGPEEIGGMGDLGARIDEEVARTGRDPMEVGEEIFFAVKGVVCKIPGLPDMYDYESFPQEVKKIVPLSILARAGYNFLKDADGLILTTSTLYEISGSWEALKNYMAKADKCFAIGPLLPVEYSEGHLSSRGDGVVASFLDDKLEEYGEKSVLFMSFGTICWPNTLDYVEEVIDCILEKKLPFIFCYAHPLAELPEPLVAKVEASGLGYLSKWAPQQYILTHPATGWYLTHCGWGGVTEALGAGIPMIAWPFNTDQPHNAAHLSENLKVAIELVEVRTGESGLRPMRRHGKAAKGTRAAVRDEFLAVIDDMRGAKGAELRANAECVKAQYAAAWQDGGDAKKELQAFLKTFVLRE